MVQNLLENLTAAVKLAVFAVMLAATFALGMGLGAVTSDPAETHQHSSETAPGASPDTSHHSGVKP